MGTLSEGERLENLLDELASVEYWLRTKHARLALRRHHPWDLIGELSFTDALSTIEAAAQVLHLLRAELGAGGGEAD